MALTSEQIAAALELDYEANAVAVDEMRKRINAHLAGLDSDTTKPSRMGALIKEQLKEWQTLMEMGEEARPTDVGVWCSKVDERISRAEKRYEESLKEAADTDIELMDAFAEQQERFLKEAAENDRMADIRLQEYSSSTASTSRGYANMDEVTAAKLGVGDAVGTSALASCTGVTLYDPVTKVGAVMHVYQGKVTIQDALKAMQAQDPNVGPKNLQVTLMPGIASGVNTAHIPGLREQLAEAGITQVRDFSKEGRTSSTLQLRGDGIVLSTSEAEKMIVGPARSDSLDSRRRPGTVNSTASVDSPAVPAVSTEAAGTTLVSSHPPPPPQVKNLPTMADSPELDSPGPEIETSAKKLSVGETLRMGKHAPAKRLAGPGEDITASESRPKRSQSEPNLKTGRRW